MSVERCQIVRYSQRPRRRRRHHQNI